MILYKFLFTLTLYPNMNVEILHQKTIMTEKKPFFGKTNTLIERIYSLDNKWFVEFWMVRYFFIGIEVYTTKKEIVKYTNGKSENGNHL